MPTALRTLSSDPLRSFKFNVYIVGGGTNNTNNGLAQSISRLGFTSMSGLGTAVEPLTYREGGDNTTTRKLPGQSDFNPVTLSRGLFADANQNWAWMQMIFSAMQGQAVGATGAGSAGVGGVPNFRTNVYINILQHPYPYSQANIPGYAVVDNNQQSIVQWSAKLYSAWIGSLAYSDLDAGSNTVGIEQMTLNYEGFDTQWGGTGYVAAPTSWT